MMYRTRLKRYASQEVVRRNLLAVDNTLRITPLVNKERERKWLR